MRDGDEKMRQEKMADIKKAERERERERTRDSGWQAMFHAKYR